MNKNLILTATVLVLSLPWIGCNKSGKLTQRSTFKPPAGPVELKLKWPQGERIVQEMNMKQDMEITIPGQSVPIKQNMTMGQEYSLTVLKETPDGGHEVEMEFLSARMKMAMRGKTMMDYDSAKKSPSDKAKPVADVFAKIIGSKIRFFLNASNEVERMEGAEQLVDRLKSGTKADALMPLKSMFSEGYFKQLMSRYRYMPPKAVEPGDSWPVQFEYPTGNLGTMMLNYTYTFQSWEMHGERNCARLEFQGTVKTKSDPDSNSSGMSIPDGNSSGVSWFDPELGITIDTTMNQEMKMVMNMPANPNAGGQMQTMTNQMNQVIAIKLLSVK
jgi:Family of unknown function (DUF6263)